MIAHKTRTSYSVCLITTSKGLLRPVFLGCDGVTPLPAPNLWCEEHFRGGEGLNTSKAYLNDLVLFYEWADRNKIDLYTRFSSLAGFSSIELRNLSASLKQSRSREATVNASTFHRRMHSVKLFCLFQMDRYLDRARFQDERYNKGFRIKNKLKSSFERLASNKPQSSEPTTPINDEILSAISNLIHPASEINPFRNEAHKVRNYCMFNLAIDAWLRRSELILLEIDDIDFISSQVTVKRPDLKNKYKRRDGASLKTRGKILPLCRNLAEVILFYVEEIRPQLISGKPPSKALFVSEKDGARLSSHSFNRIISKINESLIKLGINHKHLHPHRLRTTGATNFRKLASDINNGAPELISHSELQDILTYMGGWSEKSTMPLKYTSDALRERIASLKNHEKPSI